jgi:hypothetical protein
MKQADLFPDERLSDLKSGKSVVVSVRTAKRLPISGMEYTSGKYICGVARWADENGLLIYCGRENLRTGQKTSKWHNPFSEKEYGRIKAVQLHKDGLSIELKTQINELKGKALGCWCFPKRCHCDYLAELANK